MPKTWETMYRTTYTPITDAQLDAHVEHALKEHGIVTTREEVRRQMEDDEVWTNATYQCSVTYLGDGPLGWLHLSIKLRSRKPIHDWRDLQRIKNDVAGPSREGFEIYPAEDRLVDTANQYHIWVLPAGERIPMGFDHGRTVSDKVGNTGAGQRPF